MATDIRVIDADIYFLPVQTRMPLKFGTETMTHVTCARVCVTVTNAAGASAVGWGETPLSVTWVWPVQPGSVSFATRHESLEQLCLALADAWAGFDVAGHAIEVGHDFQQHVLPGLLDEANTKLDAANPMPWLAALVACSPFDIALHDAYGKLHGLPVYQTYNSQFMNRDLAAYLEPAEDSPVTFAGQYVNDWLEADPPTVLSAWHLVGGLDPIDQAQLTGDEPDDGYPYLLSDWIRRDGLNCLKIKLSGLDADRDYQRIVEVGRIAVVEKAQWLSVDFNCTVTDPQFVNDILDRLSTAERRIYDMILYVEQPFPYDLEANRIDVHSVAARKPLFMDESAHDWRLIRLGRSLGWTGVALKTCKTQTGALLSLCWAKAHGMALMVQDLTNPMLAQIPHVLLAAHAGTIMGVETNAMQFYPDASQPEAQVHTGLYQRRNGEVDLSSIRGPGFGYRASEIKRELPGPARRSV